MNEPAKGAQQMLAEAAEYLRLALELLDSADAPPQIGAHIDLAINQLEAQVRAGCGVDLESPTPSQPAKNVH